MDSPGTRETWRIYSGIDNKTPNELCFLFRKLRGLLDLHMLSTLLFKFEVESHDTIDESGADFCLKKTRFSSNPRLGLLTIASKVYFFTSTNA